MGLFLVLPLLLLLPLLLASAFVDLAATVSGLAAGLGLPRTLHR